MFNEDFFIERLCCQFRNFKKLRNDLYNFSCPICGDSHKNKRKARGYIYRRNDTFLYTCHNCGYTTSFCNLLKQFDSNLFKDYMFERFRKVKLTKYENNPQINNPSPNKLIKKDLLDDVSTKIIKLHSDHKAKIYLSKRHIPESWFYKLYYIEDFSKISQIFEKYKNIQLPKDERIIIPLMDKDNNLYGVMARSLNPKNKLRYVTLKIDDRPTIFNLNNVDNKKTIYVLEGAFDSMFIPNSVAVASSNLKSISEILDKNNCVLIFDSQYRNREIVNTIENAINENYYVSLLPEFDEGIKDINEWIINNNDNIDELMKIINDNICRGLSARIKLARLKKI